MVMENENPFLKRFTGMLYANEQALHDSPYIVRTRRHNDGDSICMVLLADRELLMSGWLPSYIGLVGWELKPVVVQERKLFDINPYETVAAVYNDDEATFRYKETSITYTMHGELSLQEFGNKVACYLKNAYMEVMLDQL